MASSSHNGGNYYGYRSRDGLNTRPVTNSNEIQLRIDPVHADLDDEINGLQKQVRFLKNVASEIELEAKKQNEFINQLEWVLNPSRALHVRVFSSFLLGTKFAVKCNKDLPLYMNPSTGFSSNGYISILFLSKIPTIKTMVRCYCGRTAVVRCSWTDSNPGRRFYGCPDQYSTCQFIGWFDTPMCARSKEIIPGLLRRINRVEAACRRLKMCLLASWLFFVVFLIIYV